LAKQLRAMGSMNPTRLSLLLGPRSAGKSTLLAAFARRADLPATLVLDGQPVRPLDQTDPASLPPPGASWAALAEPADWHRPYVPGLS
jgi:hypothetical protein